MANAIRVLGGGGGSIPDPVSGIEISGGASATTEQIAQIKANCLAGQSTVLSTTNKEYSVILYNGAPYVLYLSEDGEGTPTVRYWQIEEL